MVLRIALSIFQIFSVSLLAQAAPASPSPVAGPASPLVLTTTPTFTVSVTEFPAPTENLPGLRKVDADSAPQLVSATGPASRNGTRITPNEYIIPGKINWRGGEIMPGNAHGLIPIEIIYYGDFGKEMDYVTNALQNLAGSPWWAISAKYADSVHYVGQPYVAKVIHDTGSQGFNYPTYEKIIRANNPKGPASEAVYLVVTGLNVPKPGVADDKTTFCDNWLGFHSVFDWWTSWFTRVFVKYAVAGHPLACKGTGLLQFRKPPSGKMHYEQLLSTVLHELSEVVTNPFGNHYGYFLWTTIKKPAWTDANGWENADKCLSWMGTVKTMTYSGRVIRYNSVIKGKPYLIQSNWDRHAQTCVNGV